jgi:hypothetical protein
MVIAFPLPERGAGAATSVFRPTAAAPPVNPVIAVSGPRRYPPRRHGPQPRGKYGLRFYWRAMPFHNRNTMLSTIFSAADTSRDGNLMPTGGLLSPEFGNKPSIASPEDVPPTQAGCMDARQKTQPERPRRLDRPGL